MSLLRGDQSLQQLQCLESFHREIPEVLQEGGGSSICVPTCCQKMAKLGAFPLIPVGYGANGRGRAQPEVAPEGLFCLWVYHVQPVLLVTLWALLGV